MVVSREEVDLCGKLRYEDDTCCALQVSLGVDTYDAFSSYEDEIKNRENGNGGGKNGLGKTIVAFQPASRSRAKSAMLPSSSTNKRF